MAEYHFIQSGLSGSAFAEVGEGDDGLLFLAEV
jgi:hypothetical protein